jgi:mannose-6-phosphate isomerase-like protein (cupin superfamily)
MMAHSDRQTPGYSVVYPDAVANHYEDSDVPGEFRSLTEALGCEQLAATLIRVPAHSDFEQGTGHFHDEIEELYLVTCGMLTMRFGDQIERVSAPAAVRVAHDTPRSHRNEGDEPVEMWAISRKNDGDATKLDDFWDASPEAKQHSSGSSS